MSVTTVPIPALPAAERDGRVTFPHVALSEWTKLRSVRSTRYSLLVVVLFMVGISAIATAVVSARWPHMSLADRAHVHPVELTLAGVNLAQLAIGILGVLVMTGEYSTGMIRSTLTAVPRRLPVLGGKAAVFGAVGLAISVPAAFAAFFLGQALLTPAPLHVTLSAPGVTRTVVGTGLYLAVAGVLGLGIGTIVRNTAGGIAVFVALMFVIPPLMNVLPTSWNNAASPYLPSNAGGALISLHPGPTSLAPWTGFGVFCAYAAASVAIGAVVLLRRDA